MPYYSIAAQLLVHAILYRCMANRRAASGGECRSTSSLPTFLASSRPSLVMAARATGCRSQECPLPVECRWSPHWGPEWIDHRNINGVVLAIGPEGDQGRRQAGSFTGPSPACTAVWKSASLTWLCRSIRSPLMPQEIARSPRMSDILHDDLGACQWRQISSWIMLFCWSESKASLGCWERCLLVMKWSLTLLN